MGFITRIAAADPTAANYQHNAADGNGRR